MHTATDFDLVNFTLKTVATSGSSPLGNYLLLVYFLEIFDDDYKKLEAKKLQIRSPSHDNKDKGDDAENTSMDIDLEMEISTSHFSHL